MASDGVVKFTAILAHRPRFGNTSPHRRERSTANYEHIDRSLRFLPLDPVRTLVPEDDRGFLLVDSGTQLKCRLRGQPTHGGHIRERDPVRAVRVGGGLIRKSCFVLDDLGWI